MARKLKIWNGRGWGSSHYDEKGNHIDTPIEKYCEHMYVCAHSKAEAVRIVNEVSPQEITVNEVNLYWAEGCWGNSMNGIEPELGIWGTQGHDKPVRLYPKKEKYPKDRLTKCEERITKDGDVWYDLTLFIYQDNFPNGTSIDYEETGLNIVNNLNQDTWVVDCELPDSLKDEPQQG